MIPELVLSQQRGSVLLLAFNRPDVLNAWTNELEDVYFDLLAAADDDPDVRAIVITGAGRGFCSGADLSNLKNVGDVSDEDLVRPRPREFPTSLRKPLIGAINGVAAGLGFVEALYCDVRFGSSATRFTTAFAKRGLIAEYGISWMLPRLVGRSRATDLLLSSRMVGADEAYRIGLIDHLVDGDVVEAAVAYAAEIAANCSPTSLSVMKSQLSADETGTFDESTQRAETLMVNAFRGPDVVEGVASHLERRPPNFPSLSVRSSHVSL
ncbi:enoyl-CoA hydratase-related protein [Rhodococcus globerulus]|uniref:enoyl-CoA hydratase-related protein n=1 Tax=Rhodococcus globerulus TaxID=33008 RepID=UPI001F3D69C8|nr:enoyl-CoA hydratase-related protein [Rhodococcus globerulus]MCE4267872.1 enoyl-CoA hydratase/isomerase family protein [Rhodococcus globerulus]